MKVYNLGKNTQSVRKSPINSQRIGMYQQINNDIFIKSTNLAKSISFLGWTSKQFDNCIDLVTDDLINLIRENNFTKNNTQKIMKMRARGLNIFIDDLNKGFEKYPVMKELAQGAFCSSTSDRFGRINHSTLYIPFEKFQSGSLSDIADNLGAMIHEFSHAVYQQASNGYIDFRNSGKKSLSEFFMKIEHTIQNLIGVKVVTVKEIGPIYDKPFFKFMNVRNQEELENLFHNVTRFCTESWRQLPGNIDNSKSLIKFLALKSDDEANAYKAQSKAIKKFLGIDGNTNFDFVPYLYEKLAKYYESNPDF